MQRNKSRRALVKSYPTLANAELHQNEWGQTLHPGTPEDGASPTVLGEYDAAFLCRAIDNIISNEDARMDLFLRWGQMVNGWRAHTRQFGDVTVPLPIFNAYALLAKLGPERIAFDNAANTANVRGFAARRGASVQVVVYRLDEKNAEGNGDAVGVELTIKGTRGTGGIRFYRIDREHANAYRAWVALGSPPSTPLRMPTSAQVAEILAKSKPVPETGIVAIENGVARIQLAL